MVLIAGRRSTVPIDRGLRAITEFERKYGIWMNGRMVVKPVQLMSKTFTHWSPESGMVVAMPATSKDTYPAYSSLVGDGSLGELSALWVRGAKYGVSFGPGIQSTPSSAYADCLHFTHKMKADFGMVIYNPSHSLMADICKADIGNSKHGFMTQAAIETRRVMLSFCEKNPKAELIHFCHSNGALHTTRQALASLPEHIRKRITVVAIAPQCLISDEMCKKAFHIGSDRDWVYWAACLENEPEKFSNVQVIKSEIKRDWDHPIRTITIQFSLNEIIRRIQRNLT